MLTTLERTAQNHSLFNLPIDRQVMFSNHKDVYRKGVEKRQTCKATAESGL